MEEIKKFFKRDRFAEMIGIELLEIRPGYAKAKLDITDKHLNGFRAVQGGVTYTIADLVMGAASNACGQLAVTLNASITYIQSVRAGTIYAIAEEVTSRGHISTYNVTVTNQDDELICTFQGIAYKKRETLQDIIKKLPE